MFTKLMKTAVIVLIGLVWLPLFVVAICVYCAGMHLFHGRDKMMWSPNALYVSKKLTSPMNYLMQILGTEDIASLWK